MHYNKHMSNQPTMFNFTHSTALKSFILDMGEADLEMCCDFIESQGVELTPKVIDQISDILEFTVAWPSLPFLSTSLTNHMRKIEEQMNNAIANSKDWKSGNTEVTNNNGLSFVHLHGNHIATIGDDFVKVFDGGWQSNTTKSRLNAIINRFCNGFTDGVFQKDFQWFISDNKVIHAFTNGYEFAEFA